tara:strand:- start:260 stop:490 length:231 start_codon:yes stop_codon:yes gene_type:complete
MSIKYAILPADEVEDIVFSEIMEDSSDTLRYNVAETETVVKYDGAKPHFLYGKTTYSHSQILAIVSTSAWNPPLPE